MTGVTQLRSCGKLSAAGPPSTFPQPPQLRRRTNVLTMSLDDSVSDLSGTCRPGMLLQRMMLGLEENPQNA